VDLENPVATKPSRIPAGRFGEVAVALLKSIDIFTFWTLILLAIGFAPESKKTEGQQAFTIAFSVWAVYVICRVRALWIFS